MNRAAPAVIAAVLVVAMAYAASVFWIGRMVEQEVGTWSQTLAERDDVLVTRLDYDRRFGSGTLDYDLAWRPLETDPWHEMLDTLGLLSTQGLRLTGSLPVRHGPWVGGGFALAGSEASLPLPEIVRPFLPQYPGQTPLVQIEALLTFGGEAQATARVIEYRGRIQGPDMPAPGQVELAGLRGSIRAADSLDRLVLEVVMDKGALRIPDEGLAMELSGLEMTADTSEFMPRVWVGPVAFRIDNLAVEVAGNRLETSGVSIQGDSHVSDGRLSSSALMAVGQSRVDGYSIQGAGIEMALQDVDVVAYADIMQGLERLYPGTGTDADAEQLLNALGRIFAGSPRLAITRAHVSLAGQDDFVGSLGLALKDPPTLDPDAFEALLRALVIEVEARLRVDALRSGIRLHVAQQAGDSITGDMVDARSQMMVAEFLEQLRGFPALVVSNEDIHASLAVRDGRLVVGGEPVMDLTELALMGAAYLFENDAASLPGLDELTSAPDGYAEPLYGVLRLQSDFAPDPYPVEVVAGGDANLAELLGGDCVGYVMVDRPDLVLDYEAGVYDLFVYVDSGADTTLAILDPDGSWHCNDDAPGIGLNPGIEFPDPQSGPYSIWIGSYAHGSAEATLFVSEVGIGL